jgi:glycosyltransferase involved in cell wall biosynthesis
MKVLVAHNRYRSDVPSGENVVVDAEVAALREAGIDVTALLPSSDDVSLRSPRGLLDAALGPVRAPRGVPAFARTLDRVRPDVVHVHNVYPLLSPWVVRTAHARGIPVVQTVHNFRHDCVAGSYFRDGRVCTDCSGHAFATPAVAHGCYRGSRVQSVPMAVGRSVHRSTWTEVDHYLALTEFHADFLRGLGVPAERITVRPTSAPDPGPVPPPTTTDVLFVGRLDEAKGVRVLLDAWRSRRPAGSGMLDVVGDGPLRAEVESAAALDPTIVVHGLIAKEKVAARMSASGVVVIPSTWYEGLPRVLVEAAAHGRAAAVSDLGGLATAVDDRAGWRFSPDAAGLRAVLDALTVDDVVARGAGARARYEQTFAPDVTTTALLDVYADLAGSRS